MLAVVDEGANVVVYDLRTKEVVMTEPGANSVAFNTELADMLCWSGAGMLSIKSGPFPPHQQRMQGFVVGFKARRSEGGRRRRRWRVLTGPWFVSGRRAPRCSACTTCP
jgi:hypothetical protein